MKIKKFNQINESVNKFQKPFNRDQLSSMAPTKLTNLRGGNKRKNYKK